MVINLVYLSGIICTVPIYSVSPSGIFHYQFIFEHNSIQQEVGLNRKTWFRIPVIISGHDKKMIQFIVVGTELKIKGFINCHRSRNGQSKLVLHARYIKILEY